MKYPLHNQFDKDLPNFLVLFTESSEIIFLWHSMARKQYCFQLLPDVTQCYCLCHLFSVHSNNQNGWLIMGCLHLITGCLHLMMGCLHLRALAVSPSVTELPVLCFPFIYLKKNNSRDFVVHSNSWIVETESYRVSNQAFVYVQAVFFSLHFIICFFVTFNKLFILCAHILCFKYWVVFHVWLW